MNPERGVKRSDEEEPFNLDKIVEAIKKLQNRQEKKTQKKLPIKFLKKL